jgi:hypothetical protein
VRTHGIGLFRETAVAAAHTGGEDEEGGRHEGKTMTVGFWIFKGERTTGRGPPDGRWRALGCYPNETGPAGQTEDAAHAPGRPMLTLEFPRILPDFPEKRGADDRPRLGDLCGVFANEIDRFEAF